MNIEKKVNGQSMEIALCGRLDTASSPQLEAELKNSLNGITSLSFDFKNLEYISSSGLRVILSAQKVMTKQGNMEIFNVSDSVMEVFEVTGFADILSINQ